MSEGILVYLARHGERLDFVDKKWRNTAERPDDAPLTSRGERQAQDLGRMLHNLNIGSIYTSTFLRCVRTAVMAGNEIDSSLKVRVEPGICEWLNAIWYHHTDGGPKWGSMDDLRRGAGNLHGQCRLDDDYTPVRDMGFNKSGFPESREKHFQRCADVVRKIIENEKKASGGSGKNILLVGHGSSVEGLFQALCPGQDIGSVTYCCLSECVPRGDGSGLFHAPRYVCNTSFLTHAERPEDTRYI